MPRFCARRSGSPGEITPGKLRSGVGNPGSGGPLELLRLHGPYRLLPYRRRLPYRLLPHRLLHHRLLWRGWKFARTAGLEDCSLSLGMGIPSDLLAGPLAVEFYRGARGRFPGMRKVTRPTGPVAFSAPTEKAWPTRIRLW
jgi:hypothetical protein